MSFHVVFTLPQSIASRALQHTKVVSTLLFQTVAAPLRALAADPTHRGAELGLFAMRHPWGPPRRHHPHLPCVVPGGGLSPDGQRWMPGRCAQNRGTPCFRSVNVLSARVRRLFRAALLQASQPGQLSCCGDLAALADPAAFERWLQAACRQPWVVYATRPFGGPAPVLASLGRSPPRVALSHHRLRTLDNGRVSCAWTDDRHGGVEQLLSLEALACLRRFWLPGLPHGCVRLRSCGLLAKRHVQDTMATCRPRLHVDPGTLLRPTPPSEWRARSQPLTGTSLDPCPRCPQGHLVWHALPAPERSRDHRSPPASSLAAGVSCTHALSRAWLRPGLRIPLPTPGVPDSCRLPGTDRGLPTADPPSGFPHTTPTWEASRARLVTIETP